MCLVFETQCSCVAYMAMHVLLWHFVKVKFAVYDDVKELKMCRKLQRTNTHQRLSGISSTQKVEAIWIQDKCKVRSCV